MNRIVSSVLTSVGVLGGAMLGVEIGSNRHFKSKWAQDAGLLIGGLAGGLIVGGAVEPKDKTAGVSGHLAGFRNPRFP